MKIVILGAGESGVGAAILAQQKGYEVFVSDMGHIQDKYKAQLSAHNLRWEEGKHTPEAILDADEVIKSPGIPETAPMVRTLREKGIPVISEIEFAGRYTQARTICITGSNGKTTTTSLIYHILQKAGFNVGLAGNIGRSFALQVAEGDVDWYVIELSSFQLDDMFRFRADIAVLLNITPDHLDRYDFKMENYVASKMRILQNQRPQDTFIYWTGDEYIPTQLQQLAPASRLLAFADAPEAGAAAYAENGLLTIKQPLSAGVDEAAIRAGLADFLGVPHRLEKAGDVAGVHYVNDSKATNVDACYCALESMQTPVVLILGGTDKGNDYNEIAPLVREKCRALVFLGADNSKLQDFFADFNLPISDTHSMKDCVAACAAAAKPGDTVLLSPCCASFDLFRNMGDRGDQFKALVRAMQSAEQA